MAFSISQGIDPRTNGARLSLSSTEPVPTSDIIGAGTLYLLPYRGDRVSLFLASADWNIFKLPAAGISLPLTVTAAQNYDIFAFVNAGNIELELLAWSTHGAGTSTRATAIVKQNGISVKSGDPTRRYMGTLRASGSNVCEDSNANRFLYNVENQETRTSRTQDSTSSWTPSTTTAAMNFGNAAWVHNFVIGEPERVFGTVVVAGGDASGDSAACGVGLNTTGSVHSDAYADQQFLSSVSSTLAGQIDTIVPAGFHFLQGVEFTAGGAGITFAAGTGSSMAKMISEMER